LTPEIESQILSFIRSGGYPWVAAESAGIPRAVFRQWLRRGTNPGSRGLFRNFYQNVLQARAQARLSAEVDTRKSDPRFWLTHGPGREKSGAPGWTNPPPGRTISKKERAGRILTKEFLEMLEPVLQALAGFPDAREAVARELDKLGEKK
jgi:hypothetical protein